MAGAYLIMLREGFEAALIVGIVLAVLTRLGRRDLVRHVGVGVGAAVVASIAFAFAADGVSNLFEGTGQEVLNGVILAIAAAMITYVVVWVRETRKGLGAHLSARVEAGTAKALGIFLLVFLTVFREGFESVLFLWGLMLAGPSGGGGGVTATVAGAVAGIATAVGIAWALFAGGKRIPLAAFFNGTMVLLVLLAAGMLASAAGFWVSVDWLPAIEYSVWDTSGILSERSPLGSFFAVMLGYNANPSLMEVLVWAGYLGTVLLWLAAGRLRRGGAHAESRASA
jgi:high-affinity iron transporter